MEFAATRTETDIEALIRRHQAGVWRFVRVLGAAPALADDLTQEVFLVLLRGRFEVRSEAATATFLRRTARNLFLQRLDQSQRRREEPRADLVEELFVDDQDGGQYLAALRACVEELEGRPRELVERFYAEDCSREDVAAAFGMKETGVKTMLQRTRAVLRACVERKVR